MTARLRFEAEIYVSLDGAFSWDEINRLGDALASGAGGESTGAGTGFGYRDMTFEFASGEAADAFLTAAAETFGEALAETSFWESVTDERTT